ncbi:hypothetical protein CEXT_768941 [Caerostris extrusa]|uniref:Uncharacterized protein n=1 Tax=Caerostris extrusa TaxID=172846 RepID=A0AAV4V4J1_CAEEX|nr:hypothetical protein CEXT_768941 [Caerostris extrusa]
MFIHPTEGYRTNENERSPFQSIVCLEILTSAPVEWRQLFKYRLLTNDTGGKTKEMLWGGELKEGKGGEKMCGYVLFRMFVL